LGEIDRIATAIFNFELKSHPLESITSQRSQLVYDWVMTLSEQSLGLDRKQALLGEFVTSLTPEGVTCGAWSASKQT
jgi:hypothetical protein